MRTREADTRFDHWQGSLETLASAAELAFEDLLRFGAPKPSVSVDITYSDGKEQFRSVHDFRRAIASMSLADVRDVVLHVNSRAPSGDHHDIAIYAWADFGIRVNAESTSPSLAHGVVEAIKRLLEPGEDAAPPQPPRPVTVAQFVLYALSVIAIGTSLAAALIVDESLANRFLIFWFGPLVVSLLTAVGLLFESPTSPERPRLTFVSAEHEENPPPRDAEGRVLRAAGWVRERPLIMVLGSFTLGIISSLAAAAIWEGVT